MIQIFLQTIKRHNIQYARFAALYAALAAVAAVGNILSVRAAGGMTESAGLGARGDMTRFLILAAVAGGVNVLAGALSTLLRQKFAGRASHAIRGMFVRRLLFLPYRRFALKNSGEGASLFTNDVPQAAEFVATQVLSQLSQITTLLASAVFMALVNWWLTLLYFALFPLLALLQAKLSAPIGKKRMEAAERQAEYNAVVTDAFQNPLTIKAYGLEASMERRFGQSYTQHADASYAATRTHAGLALMGICATVSPMFMLWMAAGAIVINGNMSIAEFIALTIVSGPVGNWLSMFAQDLARMRRASASAMRLLEYAPDSPNGEGDTVSIHPSDTCAAAFENVTFSYPDGPKTLDGTTFSIEKGTVTAIAGESGCGKSTVLKLMLSLYRPQGGRVWLASESVSYVPQDCCLLPVSIGENIVCGLPVDEEKLRAACQNAGIHEFIQSLPDGMDSILSESAANVSGGQKQRIAMARAFYRDADLLLLDEATSALDPATEEAVLHAFHRYVKTNGKTAVVVAHRQAMLDMSDRVIRLSKGGARTC